MRRRRPDKLDTVECTELRRQVLHDGASQQVEGGGGRRRRRRWSANPGACRLALSAARPHTRHLRRECTLRIEDSLPLRLEATSHVLYLGEDVRCSAGLGFTRDGVAAQEALGDLRWLGPGGGWRGGVVR